MNISEETIEKLKKLAAKETITDRDDLYVADVCGDNFDDCYSRGCDDGETLLAREILTSLSPDPEADPDWWDDGRR